MDIKGTILRAKDGHPVPVLERRVLKMMEQETKALPEGKEER